MTMTKYEFQPVRETFMAVAMGFMLAAWWMLTRGNAHVEPLAYLESALILVIAAEAYAKDL